MAVTPQMEVPAAMSRVIRLGKPSFVPSQLTKAIPEAMLTSTYLVRRVRSDVKGYGLTTGTPATPREAISSAESLIPMHTMPSLRMVDEQNFKPGRTESGKLVELFNNMPRRIDIGMPSATKFTSLARK